MLDKLKGMEKRFDEINERLTDINVINDQEQYKNLMKELKNLTPIMDKYREYKAASDDFEEARAMLDEGGLDKDFKEMVQAQFEENKALIEQYTDELKILLLPKDPDDDKNVIIEIRGGAGGEEAALFANSLYRMYTMYAQLKGWKLEVINSNPTELGGYKEISFSVEGEGAYAKLKYESGVHRVQRVPETETQGRIHTSTITVAVLPEVEEVDVEINPADLEFQTYRSSGAGGQHIHGAADGACAAEEHFRQGHHHGDQQGSQGAVKEAGDGDDHILRLVLQEGGGREDGDVQRVGNDEGDGREHGKYAHFFGGKLHMDHLDKKCPEHRLRA